MGKVGYSRNRRVREGMGDGVGTGLGDSVGGEGWLKISGFLLFFISSFFFCTLVYFFRTFKNILKRLYILTRIIVRMVTD